MDSRGRESGQASVELVAALPALALCTLIAIQLVITGYGLWASAAAARAGARAAYVGGDVEASARSALPAGLRGGAKISDEAGEVAVAVHVPRLLPGAPQPAARARAGLDPGGVGG